MLKMPLYKRKPFLPAEKPENLKSQEEVFQIRFSKEIFRDYSEYLNRINLYRQRVWTCKVTGRGNLTYEEALVSEKRATEKIQQFPEELVVPVLHEVQFSMLPVRDLVAKVATKLLDHLSEGDELYGKRNSRVYPCKIVKVLEEGVETEATQYEVAWLDKDNKITGKSVIIEDDLIRKKLPFSRDVLKSFIRDSTYRSVPWVLHENLAKKHGISTDLPEKLKSKFVYECGRLVTNKKRSRIEDPEQDNGEASKGVLGRCRNKKEDPIKYPIDDLLVEPALDDPVFTERPSASREFHVPMDCVGDILMIWDFCCSFGRLLHLYPYSLEDFENVICNKDSNAVLIVESHSAVLRLLIKDEGEYSVLVQKKSMKPKITLVTWTEYLCIFLELVNVDEVSSHMRTIRRGHYGLLDIRAKLGIFRELICHALNTSLVREKLDEYIEQRREINATKRVEALEAAKKKREDNAKSPKSSSKLYVNGKSSQQNGDLLDTLNGVKNRKQVHTKEPKIGKTKKTDVEDVAQGLKVKSPKSSSKSSVNGYIKMQNGDVAKNRIKVHTPEPRIGKKQKIDLHMTLEEKENSPGKTGRKTLRDDCIEATENMSREEKNKYLEKEMEKRFVRTSALGKDRDHNKYWFFRRDGRIFVESSDSLLWGYYSNKEELDALMGSLNPKGERERALKQQLGKHYDRICSGLRKRSKDIDFSTSVEDADVRRSTRVRAPPRENPAYAFRNYINKWKED